MNCLFCTRNDYFVVYQVTERKRRFSLHSLWIIFNLLTVSKRENTTVINCLLSRHLKVFLAFLFSAISVPLVKKFPLGTNCLLCPFLIFSFNLQTSLNKYLLLLMNNQLDSTILLWVLTQNIGNGFSLTIVLVANSVWECYFPFASFFCEASQSTFVGKDIQLMNAMLLHCRKPVSFKLFDYDL